MADGLFVTQLGKVGFSTTTGDWIDDTAAMTWPLRAEPLDLNQAIEARLKEVKDTFLENRHLINSDDLRMMEKIKAKRKAEGKKPPKWCLTLCSPHIFKPLADIWKRAAEQSNIAAPPLVIKREALDELIKVLYLSSTERRGAHHEYVISKKHGIVFVDSKPSFYKLQEWAFGRDVVDHAVTKSFIEDSTFKMYNVVLVEKDSHRIGVAAEFDYTYPSDHAPCDLIGVDSRVVDDDGRQMQQWLHSRIGGISRLTKVVYNHRSADTPASVLEVLSKPVDEWTPATFNCDRLFVVLNDLVNRAATLHDGNYFAIVELAGFSDLSPSSILEARKRQADMPRVPPLNDRFYSGERGRYEGSPRRYDEYYSGPRSPHTPGSERGGDRFVLHSPDRYRPSQRHSDAGAAGGDPYAPPHTRSSGSQSSRAEYSGGYHHSPHHYGGSGSGSHSHREFREQHAPPHSPHHHHQHQHHLQQQPPLSPTPLPTEPPFTAFVRNLSFTVTEDDLAKFFSCHCRVVSVSLQLDTVHNRPKGFGWVEFQDLESLKAALTADGEEFQGRNLKVEVARQQQRRSGGGAAGGAGGAGGGASESRADQELRWSRGKTLTPRSPGRIDE